MSDRHVNGFGKHPHYHSSPIGYLEPVEWNGGMEFLLELCKFPKSLFEILYSGFYLRGPNFCEICEVLTSLQILILKQFFSFSFR